MATLATVSTADKYTDEVSMFGLYMNDTVSFAFDPFQNRAFEYPGAAALTTDMLDHFAAGDAEAEVPPLSKDLEMELLALVHWWNRLQGEIANLWQPCSEREQEGPPVPGLDEAESAMKRVRLALAAVITDTPEDDNDPLPEFLCAYRLWTRSISEMARKGWPGIDWSYLDQVV